MKSILFVLTIIASLNADGISFNIESHGFILNWITIQPSLIIGLATSASADRIKQDKLTRNFYVFAGYYTKLKEGSMTAKVSGSLLSNPEVTFGGQLPKPIETDGELVYKVLSLADHCDSTNPTKPLTLAKLDSDVVDGQLIIKVVVDCALANGVEAMKNRALESAANLVGEKKAQLLSDEAGKFAPKSLNDGLNIFNEGKKVRV